MLKKKSELEMSSAEITAKYDRKRRNERIRNNAIKAVYGTGALAALVYYSSRAGTKSAVRDLKIDLWLATEDTEKPTHLGTVDLNE